MGQIPGNVLVKACLNGGTTREQHAAVPISPEELAAGAREAVEAGAGALHLHPRRPDGAESLEPAHCDAAVRAIRDACPGVPLGLTTGLWIAEGDLGQRFELVSGWTERPDFASVNLGEPGAFEVCELLWSLGIGVEAGLAARADAEWLVANGLAPRCVRILVEVEGETQEAAVQEASSIDDVLDQAGLDDPPRLHHGFGMQTWAVIEAGLVKGRDVRIGLEDVGQLPDGSPARDNADLVAAAVEMARRHSLVPIRPTG